jgi:hypothetical protein
MSPEQRAQFDDMMKRLEKLERAENVSFIKSLERNSSLISQADLDALTLTDLSDVTITSPSNGQVLKYNGTVWAEGTDEIGAS